MSCRAQHTDFALGIMKSHLAGDFVSQQARIFFATSQPPVPLTPHYMVSSKAAVDAGAPANVIYRKFEFEPDESFRRLQEERVLTEFKESVVQIWGGPGRLSGGQQGTTNEEVVRGLPGRPFEMPDGWNQVFGAERFRIAEGIFDSKMAFNVRISSPLCLGRVFPVGELLTTSGQTPEHPAPAPDQTLPALVQASLNAVDVDIRAHLLSNVVVTGGSSLLYGFTDRLHTELTQLYPSAKVRLSAPGNTAERKFASWIGGSILASLGTFHQVRPSVVRKSRLDGAHSGATITNVPHQMWISKKEWEEHGAIIIEKRCK